jgi:nucleoside phosphorylase
MDDTIMLDGVMHTIIQSGLGVPPDGVTPTIHKKLNKIKYFAPTVSDEDVLVHLGAIGLINAASRASVKLGLHNYDLWHILMTSLP